MHNAVYDTSRWRSCSKRAKARDGNRCTVARLLGGPCRGRLHAHHIIPLREGGPRYDVDNIGTACAAHHSSWESLRRILARRRRPRCPHVHRSMDARLICEARLLRHQQVA